MKEMNIGDDLIETVSEEISYGKLLVLLLIYK